MSSAFFSLKPSRSSSTGRGHSALNGSTMSMTVGDRSFDFSGHLNASGLERLKEQRQKPGHRQATRLVLEQSDLKALQRSGLYSSLPVLAQAELTARLIRRRLEARQHLVREGEHCDSLHIVVRGRFKAVSTSVDGDELVIGFYVPGDSIGVIPAADGGPSNISAVSLGDSEVLSLPADELKKLALESPHFAFALVQLFASRLRSAGERVEDAYFYDLETRMARCLVKLARHCGVNTREGVTIDVPLSQSELAGMLGAGRSRVNQLLNQYEDEGIIRLSRRSVTIVRPDLLRLRARFEGLE